ncbi:DUF2254 domain-containing protein [uncultured Nitrospira sp.]|uniref:DUF2254 domain-containing protein n=1 Tax=uncultured Nitrospira sp. TaxID=157176 RepID=UPI00314054F3
MPAWVSNWLNKLRSSLWLIPTCMAIAAIFLSLAVPYLDAFYSPKNIDSLQWLSNMGPEGAMTLLSTIAGSMITIAGVVFSITIVALTLASGQFGPRLLGNFLRDRGNQIVLGTFVATFLYCLLVLRTIHVDPDGYTPYWGTLVGLLLAVCSLGVLIYFMHHIAVSIQAPNLIASVYEELEEDLTRLFPEQLGTEEEKKGNRKETNIPQLLDRIERDGLEIKAEIGGYLQAVENNALLEIAREQNLVVFLHYRPGHFITKGASLAKIIVLGPMADFVSHSINKQMICGAHRTQEQDIEFSVLQLVEVAVRALSPGINDPFTCINCIDHLSAILCQLCQRSFPSPFRYDSEGILRVIAPSVTFEGVLNAAFNQIRQHGKDNVAVIICLLEGLGRIGETVRRHEDREALHRHVEMLQRGSRESIKGKNDLEAVEDRCRQVMSSLSNGKNRSFLLMEKLSKILP